MQEDGKDDPARLRARINELEAELTHLKSKLRGVTTKFDDLFQLRNVDQENLFSLQIEAATLRERFRDLARDNDNLRGLVRSRNFAGPNQMVVCPGHGLSPQLLDLQPNQGYVLMPFGPPWSTPVYDAIKKAFVECGKTCQRADKETEPRIMQGIWCGICESGIVVADITYCNPNVMYELGLAAVTGRKIILISQTADPTKLAFDLLGLRLLVYSLENLPTLTADLHRSLCGNPPSARSAHPDE